MSSGNPSFSPPRRCRWPPCPRLRLARKTGRKIIKIITNRKPMNIRTRIKPCGATIIMTTTGRTRPRNTAMIIRRHPPVVTTAFSPTRTIVRALVRNTAALTSGSHSEPFTRRLGRAHARLDVLRLHKYGIVPQHCGLADQSNRSTSCIAYTARQPCWDSRASCLSLLPASMLRTGPIYIKRRP
jgi:hypothetical protein